MQKLSSYQQQFARFGLRPAEKPEEIHTAGNVPASIVRCIPINFTRTGLLRLAMVIKFMTQQIVDYQIYIARMWRLEANTNTTVERIGIGAQQTKILCG